MVRNWPRMEFDDDFLLIYPQCFLVELCRAPTTRCVDGQDTPNSSADNCQHIQVYEDFRSLFTSDCRFIWALLSLILNQHPSSPIVENLLPNSLYCYVNRHQHIGLPGCRFCLRFRLLDRMGGHQTNKKKSESKKESLYIHDLGRDSRQSRAGNHGVATPGRHLDGDGASAFCPSGLLRL